MGFSEHLGLTLLSHGEGGALVQATVAAEHLNLLGTAHGGFLYALADEAFALASNSRGAAVALSVHMDYFKAVRAGEVVRAEASEEHLGRRTATYRVAVSRAGEPVALFTGTVYRLEGS